MSLLCIGSVSHSDSIHSIHVQKEISKLTQHNFFVALNLKKKENVITNE